MLSWGQVESRLFVSPHVGFWQLENRQVNSEVRDSDITVTHEHREYCAGCPGSHGAPTYLKTCICVVAQQYYIRKVAVILNDNLPQSHDCIRYVSWRVLAPPLLWVQKHADLRAHDLAHTLPTSDTCLGTLTLLAPEAGDFVEFILRYAVLSYQYRGGDVSVIPYYVRTCTYDRRYTVYWQGEGWSHLLSWGFRNTKSDYVLA